VRADLKKGRNICSDPFSVLKSLATGERPPGDRHQCSSRDLDSSIAASWYQLPP
jgi:hypothetical protein